MLCSYCNAPDRSGGDDCIRCGAPRDAVPPTLPEPSRRARPAPFRALAILACVALLGYWSLAPDPPRERASEPAESPASPPGMPPADLDRVLRRQGWKLD